MTDARDPHDDAVDAAWRAQSRDVPPAAIDAAILAAAHRAVQSVPRAAVSPPRWRAFAPIAVAATLGVIAFGVLQLAPRDETPERVTSDAPVASLRKSVTPDTPAPSRERAPEAAAARAAPDRPAEKKDERPLPEPFPAAPTRAQRTAPTLRQPAAPPPAPSMVQPAAPARGAGALQPTPPPLAHTDAPVPAQPGVRAIGPLAAPREAQDLDARSVDRAAPASKTPARPDAADALAAAPRSEVAAAPPPAASTSGASAPRAKVASVRTPDAFILELRRLRAEGQDAEALRTLGAFRAAYADADARLPEDLQAWARGVPH